MKWSFWLLTILPTILCSEEILFEWPVVGYRTISGTFGEFRPNHFHMGQDFSTGGKIGAPIIAVDDGKVIRVQRSWNTIGNAITIEHRNGFLTRYGHLHRFSKRIHKALLASKIADVYKKRQNFDISFLNPLEVERGEVIAISGDTGIGPPHLHFEVMKDGIYYNPKDFGLSYEEGEDVVLDSVIIQPSDTKSFVNGDYKPVTLKLREVSSGKFEPLEQAKLKIQGSVSVNLITHQKSANNHLGLQALAIYLNSTFLQGLRFDAISKVQSRKSVLVYDVYNTKMNGYFIYNLFTKDGNDLDIMSFKNSGSGNVSSLSLSQAIDNILFLKAKGLGGKESTVTIPIESDFGDYSHIVVPKIFYNVFHDRYSTIISADRNVELFFPVYSIFSKGYFKLEENKEISYSEPGMILESKVYSITPEYKEFNLGFDIYIRMPNGRNYNRASLYEITSSGKAKIIPNAGLSAWGNYFKARIRKTGNFAIITDNRPPEIALVDFPSSGVFEKDAVSIQVKVNDVGSGYFSNSIVVKVDGESGLADINPHTGIGEIFSPPNINEVGIHKATITALDRAGNLSNSLEFQFTVVDSTQKKQEEPEKIIVPVKHKKSKPQIPTLKKDSLKKEPVKKPQQKSKKNR